MSIRWNILVIEDDHAFALGLIINLEEEGYTVFHALSAEQGLDVMKNSCVDLVVLDLMLPGMDGISALEHIRRDNPRIPVLILTACSDIQDRIKGLGAGADDYLAKPVHLEEFLLRVRRMLERYAWYRSEDRLRVGGSSVDFNTLEIRLPDGKTTRITPHEANLIQYLSQYRDRIVTRSELLKNVWDLDPKVETRTVDTFISRIRRYIEEEPSNPRHIISVRGRGYRFMP